MMHERGKSDSPIVSRKPPNNAAEPAAEAGERRGLAKGNSLGGGTRRTQRRGSAADARDPGTSGSTIGQETAVPRAPAPCLRRWAIASGVRGMQSPSGRRRRWRDLGGLREGLGGQATTVLRRARIPHERLYARSTGLLTKKVNWVLDADIQSFFDTLEHGWLVRFLEHRVGDRGAVRLIQKG